MEDQSPTISLQDSNDRSRQEADRANAEKALNGFRAKKTVNGVEISVAWSPVLSDQGYTIYLPQIEDGEKQVIRLGKNPEVARNIFEQACNVAEYEPNVHRVYEAIVMAVEHLT